MHDEQDPKEGEMRYADCGLTPEEGRELQAQLDAGEWQGLLAVQQLLAAPAMAFPDAAFSNHVLARLAVRERFAQQRRSALGGLLFGLGTMLFTGFLLWSSPLAALAQTNGWVSLATWVTFLVPAATTTLLVLRTFATALSGGSSQLSLFFLALFAFLMTLLWTRLVMRPALSNRPIRAREAD